MRTLKTKLTLENVLLMLLTVYFIFCIFLLYTKKTTSKKKLLIQEIITDTLKPIEKEIPESLNYVDYRKKKREQYIQNRYPFGYTFKSTYHFSNFRFTKFNRCDSCNVLSNDIERTYWLELSVWGLDRKSENHMRFHVNNQQAYLRKVIWDKRKVKNDILFLEGHYIDKPVDFIYNHLSNAVLVPIDGKFEKYWNILDKLFFLFTPIYFLLILLKFIQFLLAICRGFIFTNENLRRIRFIAIGLLLLPLLNIIINLCFRITFHSYFTEEIVFNQNKILDFSFECVLSMVFLLMFKAFKVGMQLKEDQELTI